MVICAQQTKIMHMSLSTFTVRVDMRDVKYLNNVQPAVIADGLIIP